MRKILFYGFLLFIFVMLVKLFVGSVQTSRYKPVQAQAITINTEYPIATSTPQPTFTIVPSATIDYQQTAIVAQSTADEARRINSMATAEYVRLINEQLAMTQVVEQQNFVIQSWTITAALTTIPLTATQQAAINTQIPQQQMILAGQMTATHDAPQQVINMAMAENSVRFKKVNSVVDVIAKISISIFAAGVIAFIFLRLPPITQQATQQPQAESKPETVVWIKNTKDNGAASVRFVVPCSPEQLTELAENITQGNKTLAINQWEGKDTLFTRDVILKVRAWLRQNDFVIPTDDGQLAPTAELFDFLCGWLETKKLPSDYEFAPHSPSNGVSKKDIDLPLHETMNMISHAKIMEGEGFK